MTEIRFLRLPDVQTRVGLSRSQIYRMIQNGEFPAPVKIGGHISVWADTEIHGWQQEVLERAGRDILAASDSTNS